MGRIWAWQTSWNMVKAHPLTGVGFGQRAYLESYDAYRAVPEDHPHAAHSVWFALMGETGLIGLGLYAWMLYQSLVVTRQVMRMSVQRAGRKGEWDWNYAAGLQCTLITFIIAGTFLSQPRFEYVLVICTIVVPLYMLSRAQQPVLSPLRSTTPQPATVGR